VYGYLSLSLGSSLLLGQLQHGLPPEIRHAALVMTQTGWVFFWVFALLVLFNAFLPIACFCTGAQPATAGCAEAEQCLPGTTGAAGWPDRLAQPSFR
jgi:hypothetical protein